ncbi:MAG: hypothetical protein JWN97_4 [Nocardioides sp.]|nr:hypothetical protein [Nocardioides sp.]
MDPVLSSTGSMQQPRPTPAGAGRDVAQDSKAESMYWSTLSPVTTGA